MFNWIKNFFAKKENELQMEQPDIDWVEFAKRRPKTDGVNMYDKEERETYIRGCLEQLGDLTVQAEQLTFEYNLVTAYLTDMEEIDALPEAEKAEVADCANKIIQLSRERKNYEERANRLTEIQYLKMERIADDMPQPYEKLCKCEEYQAKIKQDLMRLDGERHAFYYRKDELETGIMNAKGMTVICACAFAICMGMLFGLKVWLEMDIQAGYLIAIAAAAVTLTTIFIRHMDYKKELSLVGKGINQLILLQNKVKIRYVNNTNLLEYLCIKYDVSNGKELQMLWEKYQEEHIERERIQRAEGDFEFYEEELIKLLRRYRVNDAKIWIHQAHALVDNREMVEIRHGLIERRQRLRKQISYNQEIAKEDQEEVKKIVEIYPQFADEVWNIVSEYENQYPY